MNGAIHDQLQAEIILTCIIRANMIDRVTDLIRESVTLPTDVDRSLLGKMGRVLLSFQIVLVHTLKMIFPLVGHPCKFWSLQILEQF